MITANGAGVSLLAFQPKAAVAESSSPSSPQHEGFPFRHRSSKFSIVHSNTGLWILRFTMLCCSHSHMEKVVRDSTLQDQDKYESTDPVSHPSQLHNNF
jgi:hypothetical protein